MTTRETKTPGIPDIRDDNVLDVLRAIKTTLEVREGRSGDPLDQNATLRDLSDLGLADPDGTTKSGGGGTLPVGSIIPGGGADGYNPSTDMGTPPAPTGLAVSGGFTALYLSWDGAPYRNHAYTEVWRAPSDNLSIAVKVGTSTGSLYTDPAEPSSTYWYWIRFVSKAGVVGPWNLTSGTSGSTALDVQKAIDAFSGAIVGSSLWGELSQQIGKIQTDSYITNRAINSSLTKLSAGIDVANSRILELHSVTQTQATKLTVLESVGGGGNRTFFTIERPDASAPGFVANIPLLSGDVWYDTDDNNRSYRWNSLKPVATAWEEFVSSSTTKVYHQASDPAIFVGGIWQDSTGRHMADGDLWYDLDDTNHPYRWNGTTNAWLDIAGGDNSAAVITLEQTKIGYATLNVNSRHGPAGSVFDNGGAIWNNVPAGDPAYGNSCGYWNDSHNDVPGTGAGSDSEVTWHIGLPFAKATKQVGITAYGGATIAMLDNTFTAMQKTDGDLLAQYTVKIDTNGYVSGFGLANTVNNAVPSSLFLVNADSFGIGPAFPGEWWSGGVTYAKNKVVQMTGGTPVVTHVFQSRQDGNYNNPPKWGATKVETDAWWADLSARLPFMATTNTQVVDGVTYPPGVWIQTAYIADASIVSAKIGTLVADKITTGSLWATIGIASGKIYNGVVVGQVPGTPAFGTGYFLGDVAGTNQFFIGTPDSNALWDGTNFRVKGTIYGTAGSIGGTYMSNNTLYSSSVNGFNSGTGFFLDNLGNFRVGVGGGARIEWNASGGYFVLTDQYDNILMSSGGIPWDAIRSGTPPASVNNNNPAVNNANVSLSGGAGGTIILSGGAAGSVVSGVVMPGNQITPANASTYLAAAAITNAYIGNLIASNNFNGGISGDQIVSTGNTGWAIDKYGNAVFNGLLCTINTRAGSVLLDGDSGYPLYTAAVVGWNFQADTYCGNSVMWDPSLRFYGPGYHGSYTYNTPNQRVRSTTVNGVPIPTLVNFAGTVDHYVSIWARRNGGDWVYFTTIVEPQAGYGSNSISYSGLVPMDYWDYIDFGFSVTDSNFNPWNWNFVNARSVSMSVMMFNA